MRKRSTRESVKSRDAGSTRCGPKGVAQELRSGDFVGLKLKLDPETGEAWFNLYCEQALRDPGRDPSATVPLTHSLAKIRLF